MAGKNLHDKPFDEATLAKLEIFEEYLKAWLPTFCSQPSRTLCIFDFFAGTGYDKKKVPGSPIRILQIINLYLPLLTSNKITIKVFLNEFDLGKFKVLKESWENYLGEYPSLKSVITYRIDNEDFGILFKVLHPTISKFPSLVFLDQNGIKFASNEYFSALEKLNQTDFLFFISSSYIWRFGEKDEFQKYLQIDVKKLKQNAYRFIHQEVVKALRNKIPTGSKLKLYPFSIRKGSNIYGLVFGAKHLVAVDKFLGVVWKRSPINGNANFDINEDATIPNSQYSLFPTPVKLNKIEKFQQLLEEKIKSDGEISNIDLYKFTLEQGHLTSHTKDHLLLLKTKSIVDFNCRSPKINYEACKKNDVVMIHWVAKKISIKSN